MKTFLKVVLITVVLLAGTFRCQKDSNNNGIPIIAVDIYIYTSNPSYINLNAVGGWVYVTGGSRGILVYRKSTSEFMAYDRNCTYHPTDLCATVTVDASNIIAVDTCCHSKFSIYDGSVLQGPAGLPLKAYNTTFDGASLHIYN